MEPARTDRRGWLLGLTSVALSGCADGCRSASPSSEVDPSELELREIAFDNARGGPQKASVLLPRWTSVGEKLPLLIALHGRGEANRGLEVGAWGWVRDYGLDRTMARLRHPPLRPGDLQGIATPSYLSTLNARIRDNPFRGLIVACPHTPDILGTDDLDAAAPFAAFLVDHLIEEVRRRFAVIPTAQATGIDGVSLGGRMALLVAAERPDAFGAVGSLQAAFRVGEVGAVAQRLAESFRGSNAPRRLRILTSDGDPFRPTLHKLAMALGAADLPVRYDVVPGPHDHEFNRGPGGYEMLCWHDAALRETPPTQIPDR